MIIPMQNTFQKEPFLLSDVLQQEKKKKETGILALCILYHIQKVSIKAYAFVTDTSRKQNSICMMGCWEKKKKEQKKIPTVKLFFP